MAEPTSGGGYDDRIREAQTAIQNLDTRIATRRAQLNRARAGLKGQPSEWDADGNPTKYAEGTPDAVAAYNEAAADLQNLQQERADWVERRQKLQDEKANQPGQKQLTKEEREALAIELDTARSEAREAAANATVADLEANAAKAAAAAAADPANKELVRQAAELERRATEAGIAASEASVASQALRDSLAVQAQNIDNMLAPYKARQEAAGAVSAESQADMDAANAKYAEDLARLNAELQAKNVTWQEYQNESARLKNEYDRTVLALGGPEADVEGKQLANEGTRTANTQLEYGEAVTKLNQMRDAIARGDMSVDVANKMAFDYIHGSTAFDRQKQVEANASNLTSQALSAGILTGKNQKTTDVSGLLGQAFGKLGFSLPKMDLAPMSVPEWMGSMGMQTDPNAITPTFGPDGQMLQDAGTGMPAWLEAGPEGYDIGPQDYAAMKGQQALQTAHTVATQAQAPVAAPAAAGAAATNPVINISFGGGPPNSVTSQAGPPPPIGGPPMPANVGPPAPVAPPATVPPVQGPPPTVMPPRVGAPDNMAPPPRPDTPPNRPPGEPFHGMSRVPAWMQGAA